MRKKKSCYNITHLTLLKDQLVIISFRLPKHRWAKRVHLAFDGHNQELVDLKFLVLRLSRELSR